MKDLENVSGIGKNISDMRFLFLDGGMDIDPPARKAKPEYMSTYTVFSILFMMYSFGVYSGGVYFSNLKDGNHYALTVEKGAGLLIVPALCFLITFTLLLAKRVKRW